MKLVTNVRWRPIRPHTHVSQARAGDRFLPRLSRGLAGTEGPQRTTACMASLPKATTKHCWDEGNVAMCVESLAMMNDGNECVCLNHESYYTKCTARPVSLILALDSVRRPSRPLPAHGGSRSGRPARSTRLWGTARVRAPKNNVKITADNTWWITRSGGGSPGWLHLFGMALQSPLLLLEFANSIVRALGLQGGD